MTVLLPGALWYKGAQRSVAGTAAGEAKQALQQRLNSVSQSFGHSLELVGPWLWDTKKSSGSRVAPLRLRRDLPFDLATVFTHDRDFYDGFRILSKDGRVIDLTSSAAKALVSADSGLLDRVAPGQPVAGVLNVEDKPLLVSIHRLSLDSLNAIPGFILVGKWLRPEHFNPAASSQQSAGVDFYSLVNDAALTDHIRSVIPIAQRNRGFFYELDGQGSGVLYSVIEDINGRPALIASTPWQAPWRSTGTFGFGAFFSASALAGLSTWALLVWGDSRSRRRVRRFEGLSSLGVDQIKVLVESFPGYAFAIKSSMEYVGVSRILAGVSGHEPSYFCGQIYGSIAAEGYSGSYNQLFTELRDSKRWPKMAEVDHKVEGLGACFHFAGSAHYLAKQDILLIILSSDMKSIPTGQSASSVGQTQRSHRSDAA